MKKLTAASIRRSLLPFGSEFLHSVSENMETETHRTTVILLFCMRMKLGSSNRLK